jgi:hypothetical protein
MSSNLSTLSKENTSQKNIEKCTLFCMNSSI